MESQSICIMHDGVTNYLCVINMNTNPCLKTDLRLGATNLRGDSLSAKRLVGRLRES